MGLRGQILCGFGVLILVVGALLWLFQIVLLEPFYRTVKTAEVKAAAEVVQRHLDSEDLDEQVEQLCLNTGISIVVTDEMGQMLSGWKASRKECYLDNLSQSRLRLADLFDDVNLNGGRRLEVVRSPFVNQDGTRNQVVLYVTICRTPAGLNRMVVLESEITPVDSIRETLLVQVTTLTAVTAALGVALALFIARRISRPLTAMNEGAKVLGRGDYAIRFEERGAREVRELAGTLNYAAQELSKVEGLRRDLLANVSHDLRTPLTLIKGYAETVRDITGDDKAHRDEQLNIIVDEADRLTALVSSVMELSKVTSGADKCEPVRFDMGQLCDEVSERYDAVCAQNGWTLKLELPDAPLEVYADPAMIERALHNLLGNAMHHIGPDGVFILRAEPCGEGVRVEVEDHGPGISAEDLPYIFERYYRSRSDAGKAGTGLGLSITKAIFQQHGFRFGVQSTPGKGSVFWFTMKAPPTEE